MKKILYLLLISITIFSLTGCGNNINKKIAGTWTYEWKTIYGTKCEEKYIFKEKGTGTFSFYNYANLDSFSVDDFRYEVKDDIITVISVDPTGDAKKEKILTYIQLKEESNGIVLIDLCNDNSCNHELQKDDN